MRAQTILLASALLGATACQGDIGAIPAADSPGSASGNSSGDPTTKGGGSNGPSVQLDNCSATLTPRRIWKLSDDQYKNVVTDLLGSRITVPAVSTTGHLAGEFINLSDRYVVDGALAASVRGSAQAVAADSVKDLTGLLKCAAGQDQTTCVGAFIDRFAPRAYRRPIDDADRQALMDVYNVGVKTSQADGVRLMLEAILQSPSFLYRTELGTDGATGTQVSLTSYELASSLSFLLTDSMPDDELWAAAQDGSLSNHDVFVQQLNRVVRTQRAQDNIAKIYLKWFGLGAGVTAELDKAAYPEYTDALRQSMYEESSRFISNLLSKSGTFTDLLTSRSTFVDKSLAGLYGVPYTGGAAGGFVEATLPNGRAGILTQAGLLASKSRGHPVVIRGHFVLRDLFCQDVPNPPNGVNLAMFSNLGLTERGESEKRQETMPCNACHKRMDQFGLALLKYDPLARYRETFEDGTAIDSSSTISGTDVDGPIASPVDLANALGRSPQAKACMSQNILGYALGVDPTSTDECQVANLVKAVDSAGGHLSDIVNAIAESQLFAVRAGGQ